MTAKDKGAKGKESRGIFRARTGLEWGLLIVSLAAVSVLAGGLVLNGVFGDEGSADLRVEVSPGSSPSSEGQAYQVTVTNVGGASAEAVVLEVTSGDLTREVNIELIAKGDTEHAQVIFPGVSADGQPLAEVISFEEI